MKWAGPDGCGWSPCGVYGERVLSLSVSVRACGWQWDGRDGNVGPNAEVLERESQAKKKGKDEQDTSSSVRGTHTSRSIHTNRSSFFFSFLFFLFIHRPFALVPLSSTASCSPCVCCLYPFAVASLSLHCPQTSPTHRSARPYSTWTPTASNTVSRD